MNNALTSVLALAVCAVPVVAEVTPDGVENWMKIGGLASLVFILSYQLLQSYKQNNELRKQLLDAVTACKNCPLAKAANEELIKHSKD